MEMDAGIAYKQLLKEGILGLNNVEVVAKLCAELKDVKFLGDDGEVIEK